MSDLVWMVVRNKKETSNYEDIRVINVFDSRTVVIGELVKHFIRDNIGQISENNLIQNAAKFRLRLLEGDTNDYNSPDGFIYTITSCFKNKYTHFESNIVDMYSLVKR